MALIFLAKLADDIFLAALAISLVELEDEDALEEIPSRELDRTTGL